ncbi:MAG TPA: tRNA pseudouridine(55) synthase TruB [Clostridia bacterium]
MTGFVNFLKPPKMSSAGAVSYIKKLYKVNKCGHMGTLDPFACGVLPIALGRATRLFDYLINKTKVYRAIFRFGIETDTFDLDGQITRIDNKVVTLDEVNSVLHQFKGVIFQTPPKYSAKKINGERAYKLARSGEEIELKPSKVEIFDIEAADFGSNEFAFDIKCSGGTYIRSLCRDIANQLNTCGVMTCLIRTASGFFKIEDCKTQEQLNDSLDIIRCDDVLADFEKCIVNTERDYFLAINGAPFFGDCKSNQTKDLAVYFDNTLIGVAQKKDDKFKLDIRLV